VLVKWSDLKIVSGVFTEVYSHFELLHKYGPVNRRDISNYPI
jgi:hypothetical protein